MRISQIHPDVVAKCLAMADRRDGVPVAPIADTVSEEDFQSALLREARKLGWKCFHPRYSYKSEKGFFDVTMIRGNRVIFTELKTEVGTQTAEQKTWMEFAQAVGGNVEYYLWRPSDWKRIMELLT